MQLALGKVQGCAGSRSERSGLRRQLHKRSRHLACLFCRFTDVGDNAGRAIGFACLADIAPVQDQPVMGVAHEFGRYNLHQRILHLFRRLAGSKPDAIADAQDMRVDGMVG